jgi:hypothetical protein
MLRRLLDSGKLTLGEAETARKLYDDIVAGRIGGLTYEQIVWTEQLGLKCGFLPNRPGITYGKKARQEQEKALAEFDSLPRPKKPPGRR